MASDAVNHYIKRPNKIGDVILNPFQNSLSLQIISQHLLVCVFRPLSPFWMIFWYRVIQWQTRLAGCLIAPVFPYNASSDKNKNTQRHHTPEVLLLACPDSGETQAIISIGESHLDSASPTSASGRRREKIKGKQGRLKTRVVFKSCWARQRLFGIANKYILLSDQTQNVWKKFLVFSATVCESHVLSWPDAIHQPSHQAQGSAVDGS